MGLAIILPLGSWTPVEKDKEHDFVAAKVLFNWFNANPVHVLKSRYAGSDDSIPAEMRAPTPFFYGKEYLVAAEISKTQEHILALREKVTQHLRMNFSDVWMAVRRGHLPPLTRTTLFIK